MIRVKGLHFAYPRKPATLQRIDLRVAPGEVLVILGNNGAGKSTLLHCITGHLRPSAGAVEVNGVPVTEYRMADYARTAAFVPQRSEVSHTLVYDAILLGRKPFFHLGPTADDHDIVAAHIDRFDLDAIAFRYLDELSGGQQQKIAMVRALVGTPKVLILDEPTSSLDVRNQQEVLRMTRNAAAEEKIAIVAVLHDINQALRFADSIALLRDGVLLHRGSVSSITAGLLSDTYGTEIMLEAVRGVRVALPASEPG